MLAYILLASSKLLILEPFDKNYRHFLNLILNYIVKWLHKGHLTWSFLDGVEAESEDMRFKYSNTNRQDIRDKPLLGNTFSTYIIGPR